MFYDRFVELCRELNTTPAAVRKDVGISQSTMASWKSRCLTPKPETLRKLANYFGVSMDYLLGIGPRISPISPSRRIFAVLHQKRMTLEDLSRKTEISIDTLRAFALGDDKKVTNGRDCLVRIADKLDTNPAYLMGWTNFEDDDLPYLEITEKMWEVAGNDPVAAHDLQLAAEDEEYQQTSDSAKYAKRGRLGRIRTDIYSLEPPERILATLDLLNADGINEAVKRVEELAEIPRYRRKAKDTTPATDGSGAPPEGT